MTNGDRTLTCRDCREQFVFTASEQEFFSQRGFGDPVRCQPCRRAHKSARAQEQNDAGRQLPPRQGPPAGHAAERAHRGAPPPHQADRRAPTGPDPRERGVAGNGGQGWRDGGDGNRPHRDAGGGRAEEFPLPALDVRRFEVPGEAREAREGGRRRRDNEPSRDLYEENDGWGRPGKPRGGRDRNQERAYSEDW